jgi:alpha-glucosidase
MHETPTLTVQASSGDVRIYFRNRMIFHHSTEHPGFRYGTAEGIFEVTRGNFSIREKGRKVVAPTDCRVESSSPYQVTLRFGSLPTVELSLSVSEGYVQVEPRSFPPQTNRFVFSLPLGPEEHVYGCGEQFSRFDLRGSCVPLWSEEQGVGRSPLDPLTHYMNWKHKAGGHWYSTYFPQPTFITSKGLFFHADSRSYARFDFRPRGEARLEFWEIPSRFYIGVESGTREAVPHLSSLLGRMSPLPEWTYNGMWLGVQGGKDTVEKKLQDALQAGVRVGALWVQDWEGRRITSFGKQLFWNWEYHKEMYPDLPGYITSLKERNIRFLGYINTFLALEGSLYKEASAKGYCVKDSRGKDYLIYITTFPAAMVDLTNPEARRWIKRVIQENMIGIGMSGWMADFGEYLPTDAVLACGEPATLWHNPWPALWAQVNREAVEESGRLEDTVFFLRAGYTGTSRYGRAVWAGDQLVNFSRHDGLASVIPASLSLGVCGTAIHHSDLGGYTTLAWVKRKREVFQRWAELSAFTPIMRSHEGNRPDSNHQFNSDTQTLTHLARMSHVFTLLKPYHLALQEEHVATGLPIFRPLFLHYPHEPATYTLAYQYLYGQDLLVAPVTKPRRRTWRVYLPRDTWVHLWTGKMFEPNQRNTGAWVEVEAPLGYPPVFFRKSSPWEALFQSLSRIS